MADIDQDRIHFLFDFPSNIFVESRDLPALDEYAPFSWHKIFLSNSNSSVSLSPNVTDINEWRVTTDHIYESRRQVEPESDEVCYCESLGS